MISCVCVRGGKGEGIKSSMVTYKITDLTNTLEHSCNKYCDLIGQSEVSISHRDLQDFHRDLQLYAA